MPSTRRMIALCLLGFAALAYVAEASPPPVLSPGQAAQWEGQPAAIRGVVQNLRILDGNERFDLVADGHAVATRLEMAGLREGLTVEVRGRLVRMGGVLTLLGDDVVPADAGGRNVTLPTLARNPLAHVGRVMVVHGTIDHGSLVQDGHRIALGEGEWPTQGAFESAATMDYHAPCGCYRLNRVQPWTG